MNSSVPNETRIGSIYRLKLRLRSRLAMCVAENGDEFTVMIDGKTDKVVLVADELQADTEIIPESMSPAGRLRFGAAVVESQSHRVKWDAERLKQQALLMVEEDRPAQRRLYDEALEHGWEDVQQHLNLSGSEKAWRVAHEMARRGMVEPMCEALSRLPDKGYEARSGLVLPFASEILEHDGGSALVDLVHSWDETVPLAGSLQTVLGETNDHDEIRRAAEELTSLSSVEGFDSAILEAIESGQIPEPVSETTPLWAAYHLYDNTSAGTVGSQHLSLLPLSLVDDLIDAQRIGQSVDVGPLPDGVRESVLARLRPEELTEDELRAVDHQDELARRFFLSRDFSALSGLDPEREAAVHYKALSALRDGDGYDESHLRPAERALLKDFITAMEAVTAGETPFMSSDVLDDPTLWPALQDLALTNRIKVTAEQRASHPRFADWIDLHSMVALLWQGHDHDAAHTVGSDLVERLQDEAMIDEALNLRAFALWRLGQPIEALRCMEEAMEGDYTEALLVNTSIIASTCEPKIAAEYLGRLIAEAPSTDLRIAALHRSVGVWQSESDLEFPAATAKALRQVIRLEDLSDDDYFTFMNLASRVDASELAATPPPSPQSSEKKVTHDVFVARARAYEGKIYASEYSQKLIDANHAVSKPSWLERLTGEWIDFLVDGLFEDFGEPMGIASAMDAFIMNGRDLLMPNTYLYCAPRCGAHFAWDAWNNGNRLSDSAATKFFYEPIERFAVEKGDLPEKSVEIIGFNFRSCLVSFATREFLFGRNVSDGNTTTYNELSQRRRWDQENRYGIENKMREILSLDQQAIDRVKRILERAERFVADPENSQVREIQGSLASSIREWQDETIRLRATL